MKFHSHPFPILNTSLIWDPDYPKWEVGSYPLLSQALVSSSLMAPQFLPGAQNPMHFLWLWSLHMLYRIRIREILKISDSSSSLFKKVTLHVSISLDNKELFRNIYILKLSFSHISLTYCFSVNNQVFQGKWVSER